MIEIRRAVQDKFKSSKRELQFLNQSVESMLTTSSSSIEGNLKDAIVLKNARRCASLMRDAFPQHTVGVVEGCRHLLQALYTSFSITNTENSNQNQSFYRNKRSYGNKDNRDNYNRRDRNTQKVTRHKAVSPQCEKLCHQMFRWAIQANRPEVLSHVLAYKLNDSDPSRKYLIPISYVYFSHSYNMKGMMDFASQLRISEGLYFLSDVYLRDSTESIEINPSSATNRFFYTAGVMTRPLLIAASRQLDSQEIKSDPILNKVRLRSSQPSTDLHLPFGLNVLNKKHFYEIDLSFDNAIKSILKSGISVSAASIFCEILVDFLGNCEAFQEFEKEAQSSLITNHYKLLKVQGYDNSIVDQFWPLPLNNNNNNNNNNNEKIDLIPLRVNSFLSLLGGGSTKSKIPAIQRIFGLPSGQAGASSYASNRVASWINTLSSTKWIPARAPGSSFTDNATLVLRPAEVVLSDKEDKNMPTATISPEMISILSKLPLPIKEKFAFGSVKPKPPIELLAKLKKDVDAFICDSYAKGKARGIEEENEHILP